MLILVKQIRLVGHYNRSTGEYHFHHGFPAHQHIDGICPYNDSEETYDEEMKSNDEKMENNYNTENTDEELNNSYETEDNYKNEKKFYILTEGQCLFLTLITYIICILIAYLLYYFLDDHAYAIIENPSTLLNILIFFSFWVFISSPVIIFNSFKENVISSIFIICIPVIFIIFLLLVSYLIKEDKK